MGEYLKSMKIFENKPSKMARFRKHNMPKARKYGLGKSICRNCGKKGMGMITKYGLYYCRHCFREVARTVGFKKYS